MGLFSFSMPPDLRCKFIAALVLLGIALVALLGGVLGNIALDSVLKDQIKSFLVVDSESSSGYEDWQFDGAPDRTPQNMNYYLWNLTNPDEIINATRLNGTTPKPSYKLVGPFTYRRYAKKVNVSFVAGGNEVDFAHYIYYIFDSSLSTGDPSDASLRVTNLNSAYLGVLAQVGSEQNLVTALVGPSLLQLFEVISQPFGCDCFPFLSSGFFCKSVVSLLLPDSSLQRSPHRRCCRWCVPWCWMASSPFSTSLWQTLSRCTIQSPICCDRVWRARPADPMHPINPLKFRFSPQLGPMRQTPPQ